jgi:hypothetical protein
MASVVILLWTIFLSLNYVYVALSNDVSVCSEEVSVGSHLGVSENSRNTQKPEPYVKPGFTKVPTSVYRGLYHRFALWELGRSLAIMKTLQRLQGE